MLNLLVQGKESSVVATLTPLMLYSICRKQVQVCGMIKHLTIILIYFIGILLSHIPEVIANVTSKYKNLVICFDGTWNRPSSMPLDGVFSYEDTNVAKVCNNLEKERSEYIQIAYYKPGVGSLRKYPGFANWINEKTDKVIEGITGVGIEMKIEEAYRFLSQNYVPGDKIFIFGFSRGATTARGLVNFIDWSGGLISNQSKYIFISTYFDGFLNNKIQTVHDLWKKILKVNYPKRNLSQNDIRNIINNTTVPVQIEYLGLWDTVAKIDNAKKELFIKKIPSRIIKFSRHALAIDEFRKVFPPEIWVDSSSKNSDQIIQQRWFFGAHSDIGGGYSDTKFDFTAPYRWIVDGAESKGMLMSQSAQQQRPPGFFGDAVAAGGPDGTVHHSKTLPYVTLELFINGEKIRHITTEHLKNEHIQNDIDYSVFKRLSNDPCATSSSIKRDLIEYKPHNLLHYLANIPNLENFLVAKQKVPILTASKVIELVNSYRNGSCK